MTESKFVNGLIEAAVKEHDLVNARQFVILLLQDRFPGEITPEVIETINSQPSQSLLMDWFHQAVKVASFADFVRALRTAALAS